MKTCMVERYHKHSTVYPACIAKYTV